MKIHINRITIILTIVILICIILFFRSVFISKMDAIPKEMPVIEITVSGKQVPYSLGNYKWRKANIISSIDSAYELGKMTQSFIASPGNVIHIRSLSTSPNKVRIIEHKSKIENNIYEELTNKDYYDFMLTSEKGERIFEIYATWDDNHYISAIIREITQ